MTPYHLGGFVVAAIMMMACAFSGKCGDTGFHEVSLVAMAIVGTIGGTMISGRTEHKIKKAPKVGDAQ